MEHSQQTLSVVEKAGYGLGDTATNLVWRTLMVFLPIFYTDVFGITAAAVGTLLLTCRFLDGITDFIMGIIADRTETRWGKFRPWILWMALPFGIFTILTFTTPNLGPAGKLIYAYGTYIGLILVFTASNVPYSALMGVMSPNPDDRTSLSSYRFFFAFLGALIVQAFSIYLVEFFGHGDKVKGYKYTMILFAIMSVIFFLITFFTTKERVTPLKNKQFTIKDDLKDLLHNLPWVILFFLGVFFIAMTTLKQGSIMFYFKYYLGEVNLATAFMVINVIAAMLGAALTERFTHFLGKRGTLKASLLLAIVSSALLFFASPSNIVTIFVLGTLMEFSTGPVITLFFAMLADAADYSEWKNNRRATGLVFSAGTLSIKFGSGVAGALIGGILALFGYVANVTQSAHALLGIRLLMSMLPAAAALLALIAFSFYKIDDNLLLKIQKDLAVRKEKILG
ncbi:inner membrane symporter YicJ [bacterium BMS3Abin05]|nr:inner membrane symporter YicJ [bacterium BMS3Abin05]GBE27852.1 inner membrane symporter YicJ [bacterium BMS3Bbin03]HDZ12448.1 MFS transporter [Bacteroidota bacterium]